MVITIPEVITKLATNRVVVAYNHNNEEICRLPIPLSQRQIVLDDNGLADVKSICFLDFFHHTLVGNHGHEIR